MADQPIIHGCRILLAEDVLVNQQIVTMILEKVGASVHSVENGLLACNEALAASKLGNPYDIILLDMQMPVMDGYMATKRLREAGFTVPIIALTAHAMEGDEKKCLEAGCDDYATKPIDRNKLITSIARCLEMDKPARR